jgi:hypothetical protein
MAKTRRYGTKKTTTVSGKRDYMREYMKPYRKEERSMIKAYKEIFKRKET